MKSLPTLIKLHSRGLDALRQQVVKCEQEKEQLIEQNKQMEDALMEEHILASKDPEMGVAFMNYRRSIRNRQSIIYNSLKQLERKIESLKEEIALKFNELKKFEIIEANNLAKEQKEESQRETKQLDEMAVNSYLKNNGQ